MWIGWVESYNKSLSNLILIRLGFFGYDIGNVHKITKLANFGLTCIPEKGRGFVTVGAVTANLVSKDARDFKEKSHETARRDLLALRTCRAKCLGGANSAPPPPAFLGLSSIYSRNSKCFMSLLFLWMVVSWTTELCLFHIFNYLFIIIIIIISLFIHLFLFIYLLLLF